MTSPAAAMELWGLWDHIGMIRAEDSSSSQKLASARYLVREIQNGALGYQDGRDPKLKMRRPCEYTEKQLLEIVQPECVILTLAEMGRPQTIRIGREWRKGPDGKKAYEKPGRLPKNQFERWFDQRVRKLFSEWEPDADKISLDDPNLCLNSLTAAVGSKETRDEIARLIEIVTPKAQELIQELLQVFQDDPDLADKQALAKTRQNLKIGDDAGYQILYRIRKIKKVC